MSPFLIDGHIEQIFAIGLQFIFHVIDDFILNAIFHLLLFSVRVLVDVGKVLYFIPFLYVVAGIDRINIAEESFGIVDLDDFRWNVSVVGEDTPQFLLIQFMNGIFIDRLLFGLEFYEITLELLQAILFCLGFVINFKIFVSQTLEFELLRELVLFHSVL